MKFRWLGQDAVVNEGIVEAIVKGVYVNSENIYPCVDIGVGDLADDGSPIIVANVAGYDLKPFQKNWTGRNTPRLQTNILARPMTHQRLRIRNHNSKNNRPAYRS
jgi:hypothetical protein